jgi:cytoskeletal protein CcmA (bactofilin family)
MRARESSSLRSLVGPISIVIGVVVFSAPPAGAVTFCSPTECQSISFGIGETHEGDLYAASNSIDVAGVLNGDLIGWAQTIMINGEVTGDLFVGGQTITIQGRVGDSARVFCNSLVVQGEIDGDLLIFAQSVTIAPGAVVTGDLVGIVQILTVEGTVGGKVKTGGQTVNLRGEVGGDVKATVGEFRLSGSVRGDADITCDTLKVEPGASIAGNLVYTARVPLEDLEGMDVVAGSIDFEEKVDEKEAEEDKGLSLSWFVWRFIILGWSFMVGAVMIAVFRKQVPSVEAAIERETLASFGVGFVLAIPLPVAAVILCILVVTIPLSMITLVLWGVGWYVAHLAVSVWLGRRVLSLTGLTHPSPYLGLLIGLVLYKLVLWIPYLGFLAYFLTVFLGLGALFLGARIYLRSAPPKAGSVTRETSPA